MLFRKSFVSLMVASAVLAAPIASAETYALMIGIADYPDVVGNDGKPMKDASGNEVNMDLSGPVNDVTTYKDLLVNKYGVKPDNIKLLLNKDANKANFLNDIVAMIKNAKSGDQVVFVYSGHGAQVDAKDEPDGKEEVIVLADDTLVSGDLFNEVANTLSKAGVNSTLIFDSCFSGGMSRPVFSFQGKDGTTRRKFVEKEVVANMKRFDATSVEMISAAAKKKAVDAKGSYAFLFAGQENQPTIDLDFKDDTPDHGLFTLVLATLVEKLPESPIEAVIGAMVDFLKEKGFEQKPSFDISSPERGLQPMILK